MPEEHIMRLAIEKAKEGLRLGQTPFGACIARDGEVISLAHNEVWLSVDTTAHAEIVAIREACKRLNSIDLSGCEIYSTCEPCPMCFSACHWSRLERIIFGARIKDARKHGFRELNISNEALRDLGKCSMDIIGGFLSQECFDLFSYWRNNSTGDTTY